MIGDILQPTHLIFVLLVALLVLGPKRLPEVGKSLGKGLRDFRGALNGVTEQSHDIFGAATVDTSSSQPEPVMSTAASAETPAEGGAATEASPALAPRNDEPSH